MTITLEYLEYTTESGSRLVLEQYADKPYFNPFWRYRINGRVVSSQLLRKPNVKQLISMY